MDIHNGDIVMIALGEQTILTEAKTLKMPCTNGKLLKAQNAVSDDLWERVREYMDKAEGSNLFVRTSPLISTYKPSPSLGVDIIEISRAVLIGPLVQNWEKM